MARKTTSDGKAHRFGGDWTTAKLAVLQGYLASYTTALKHTRFYRGYIDAFAGTGYRDACRDDSENPSIMFQDMAADQPQRLLDRSARLAFKTEPRFHKNVFIEWSAKRYVELCALKHEFPDKADAIEVRQGDANQEIQDMCKTNWTSRRAVLFLDPYGMQVD